MPHQLPCHAINSRPRSPHHQVDCNRRDAAGQVRRTGTTPHRHIRVRLPRHAWSRPPQQPSTTFPEDRLPQVRRKVRPPGVHQPVSIILPATDRGRRAGMDGILQCGGWRLDMVYADPERRRHAVMETLRRAAQHALQATIVHQSTGRTRGVQTHEFSCRLLGAIRGPSSLRRHTHRGPEGATFHHRSAAPPQPGRRNPQPTISRRRHKLRLQARTPRSMRGGPRFTASTPTTTGSPTRASRCQHPPTGCRPADSGDGGGAPGQASVPGRDG